jgi:hypothetical protein
MNKTQTIDLLKSQIPGFYSAEQVINLIEKIEEPKGLSREIIQDIAQCIIDDIEREADQGNIVCFSDVEFELNGREIEVNDVPISFDTIRDCIENGLSDAYEEIKNIEE